MYRGSAVRERNGEGLESMLIDLSTLLPGSPGLSERAGGELDGLGGGESRHDLD